MKGFRTIKWKSVILRLLLVAGVIIPALHFTWAFALPTAPKWVGKGKYRMLVQIAPSSIGSRKFDEMPARIEMSTEKLGARVGASGRIDVNSIEVERYGASSGQPAPYGKWLYAHHDWELPYRWYDRSFLEHGYREARADKLEVR